jgi:hypothetical protein
MTTPHRTRLVARGYQPLAPRDPNISRIFVASEDTHACEKYLLALVQADLVDPTRFEVLPLPTLDGRSTLMAVLQRLDDERADDGIHLDSDEYWAVFDVDQQKVDYLDQHARSARERGHLLAGSNPCFELWLLLHHTCDLQGLLPAQEDRGAPRKCGELLHKILQAGDPQARGYDKARPGAERFTSAELVELACQRARDLSRSSDLEAWPKLVGTHVHRLIERLLRQRQPI